MRIYVAGPMTGLPELNFPAFHAAAAHLRAEGHEVVNPAEINADPSAGWLECMRADIRELVTCDAIYLLSGWQQSRGAMIEAGIATSLGFRVLMEDRPVRAMVIPKHYVQLREPLECWCHTCRPVTMQDSRMVLCPSCGNKRCPRANHHDNACTGSNEPGQPGSAYA